MKDSALDLEKLDKDRFGVIYGSGIGGMKTLQEQHFNFFNGLDPHKISPFFIPMMISDIAAGQISIKVWIEGTNYATTSACANCFSRNCRCFLSNSERQCRFDDVCGSEAAITGDIYRWINSMKALSTWNDRMKEASRPFDKDRNGFVMAIGAGTLILEDYDHAI